MAFYQHVAQLCFPAGHQLSLESTDLLLSVSMVQLCHQLLEHRVVVQRSHRARFRASERALLRVRQPAHRAACARHVALARVPNRRDEQLRANEARQLGVERRETRAASRAGACRKVFVRASLHHGGRARHARHARSSQARARRFRLRVRCRQVRRR